MNWLLSSIIAFASAAIASMGIGGGAVLLLFLTVFSDIPLGYGTGNQSSLFSANRSGSIAVPSKVRPFADKKRGCLRAMGLAWRFSRCMGCISDGIFCPFQAVCNFSILSWA